MGSLSLSLSNLLSFWGTGQVGEGPESKGEDLREFSSCCYGEKAEAVFGASLSRNITYIFFS